MSFIQAMLLKYRISSCDGDMGLGKQEKLNLPAKEREKGGRVGLSQEPLHLPQ